MDRQVTGQYQQPKCSRRLISASLNEGREEYCYRCQIKRRTGKVCPTVN